MRFLLPILPSFLLLGAWAVAFAPRRAARPGLWLALGGAALVAVPLARTVTAGMLVRGEPTTLELIHHRVDRKSMGAIGPGWEYYLDNLVAARERQPLPKFDSYYPSQKAYFEALQG